MQWVIHEVINNWRSPGNYLRLYNSILGNENTETFISFKCVKFAYYKDLFNRYVGFYYRPRECIKIISLLSTPSKEFLYSAFKKVQCFVVWVFNIDNTNYKFAEFYSQYVEIH